MAAGIIMLAGCSTNPATGQRQFAGLMSPAQEQSVGAAEHENVLKEFGKPKAGDPLQAYVESVGARVAANTERKDVQYKFFLLDTPMLNAFALPGGYVYVTRGILAHANSEAELAAVLAHEIGHITARHSAERYSHGVAAGLGAAVLGAATGSSQLGDLANVGSDLYLRSYSRSQESQADELGIRYLADAGYDPLAMARFLEALQANAAVESRRDGGGGQESALSGYFSTHPQTADRIRQAVELAKKYPAGDAKTGRNEYLSRLNGMVYGDSADQGYVRGQRFVHPAMGFTFEVPSGFTIENQPSQIVALNKKAGAVIMFDAVPNPKTDPATYLAKGWLKGEAPAAVEKITINGKPAATTAFAGKVNNSPADLRLVAVDWDSQKFFRFQMATPPGSRGLAQDMRDTAYSLRPVTAAEKSAMQPSRLRIVTAGSGDTVAKLAAQMDVPDFREEEFRALNGLRPGDALVPGQKYKIVSAS